MLSLSLLLLLSLDDRALGAWRFLPAESRYESAPAPRQSQRQWVADGDWVRFLHDGVNADGKPFHTEFRARYDGKPYPFTGGALYDHVALFWRNASRVDQVFTKQGAVTVRARRSISRDGRRMTIDARGKGFRNKLVYERLPLP